MGCDNTQSSDQTADSDVDHHSLLSVLGAEPESNNNTCDDDDTCIAEKTWSNDPFLHVLNARNRRLLGCVYCNYNGPDDAVETAYFSYKAQAFLQEYGGQYSAYDDGEGAHGGYEDGVGEGVCDEITTRY